MGLIDTTRLYETPEGAELDLRLAGPVVRAYAWIIDMGIRMLVYLLAFYVLSLLGGIGWSMILIGLFLLEWFYPVFFELRNGQTPGKTAMGIQVVNDNGTPISFSASMIRNLLRAVDALPFFYGFGLITMLLNKDFRRLGDLAAGSLVVYKDRVKQISTLPEIEPKALNLPLDVDEQLQMLLFAERSETLTKQRSIELAEIISELTGKHGDSAVNQLWGYAKWLAEGK